MYEYTHAQSLSQVLNYLNISVRTQRDLTPMICKIHMAFIKDKMIHVIADPNTLLQVDYSPIVKCPWELNAPSQTVNNSTFICQPPLVQSRFF